jgi:D-amino-acid dehydrogenase
MSKNIAVIGAGITGVLSAYYLVKRGYQVTVFEQERYPAMKTSYANGGQISVSNSEVWTTWSNVSKGIKWMFRKDAPLLIRPSLSLSKIKWLSKFLWHTVNDKYQENTAETIRLGLKSRSLYKHIIQEEGLNFDQSNCGILHIYKDSKYFENAQNAKEIYNTNGCQWDILTSRETIDSDPALSSLKNVVGGAWTADDWVGDIHKFCQRLSYILEKKYRVTFVFDLKINETYKEYLLDTYDAVVVSAGVGSVKIAKMFGDSLPIYPVKGYSITITADDIKSYEAMPKVSLLDDQAKMVTSTLGNRFRVAGTAELDGENYDIRRDRIEPLLKWVHENFPRVDTSNYSSWACLRPMTPNMMPIVKKSKKNIKVFYHTGHGHLGWTFSPATALALTELINNDR